MRLATRHMVLLSSIVLIGATWALASMFGVGWAQARIASGAADDASDSAYEALPTLVSHADLGALEAGAGTLCLTGRVIDAAGAPLEGIRVALEEDPAEAWDAFDPTGGAGEFFEEPAASDPLVGETVSGADGTFLFSGLHAERRYRPHAVVAPPRYGTGRWRWISDIHPARVTLRVLEGTRTVTVRIVDGNGRGRPGRVRVYRAEGADSDPTRSWWSRSWESTDAEGRLVLDAVPKRVVYARAAAPGVGERSAIPIPEDAQGEVLLALGEPGGPILEGRVMDTEGRPIPGAGVWATTLTEGNDLPMKHGVSVTTADDEGRYRLGPLISGPGLRVGAVASGFLPRSVEWEHERHEGATPFRVDLMLVGGGVVRGRVMDEANRPVAGAQVVAAGVAQAGTQYEGERPRTRTDARGRYELYGVAPGPGIVGAYKDGRASTLVAHGGPDANTTKYSGVPFDLPHARAAATVDIRIRPGVPVSGHAVDDRGRPLGDVRVYFLCKNRECEAITDVDDDATSVRTGADGTFEHPGLPPGSWRVAAYAPGLAASTEYVELSAAAPPAPFELTLRPRPVVSGRVQGATEASLAALEVRCRRGGGGRLHTTGVASDGSFSFDALWPGTYELSVRGALDVDVAAPRSLALDWGVVETDLVLETTRLGSVQVRAVHPDGRPAVGREIGLRIDALVGKAWLWNPDTSELRGDQETDADGHVRFAGLPEGRYVASDRSGAHPRAFAAAWPGDDDVVLVVPELPDPGESAWLEARVCLPDGRPVPRAFAAYAPGEETVRLPAPWGGTTTGEVHAGRLRLRIPADPRTGTLRITEARDAAHRSLDVQPLQLAIAPGAAPLEIVLVPGLHVSGRVVDPEGQPVAGVPIQLTKLADDAPDADEGDLGWLPPSDPPPAGHSGPDGRFDIHGLESGQVELVLLDHEGSLGSLPEVFDAGARGITLRQRRAAEVCGTVLDPRGHPVAGADVSYVYWRSVSADGRSREETRVRVKTDAEGAFTIPGAVPGAKGWLTATRPGSAPEAWLKATIPNVRAGGPPVTLRLVRGRIVRVRILDPSGAPAGRTHLHYEVADEVGGIETNGRDPTGTYELGPLPPGRCTLRASPSFDGETEALAPTLETTVVVDLPVPEVEIVLRRNQVIRGRIADPGASRWTLDVIDAYGERDVDRASKVFSDGTFAVAGADDERVTLLAWAENETRHGKLEGVQPGSVENVIRLEPGACLAGRIHGLPEEPGTIWIGAEGPHGIYRGMIGREDGTFAFTGLLEGAYELHVQCEGVRGQARGGPFRTGTAVALEFRER